MTLDGEPALNDPQKWILEQLDHGGEFGLTAAGEPGMELFDKEAKYRGGFSLTADGRRSLVLADKGRKPRGEFGVKGDGTPSLRLFDQEGKVIFQAP